jgi:hypothetical protein
MTAHIVTTRISINLFTRINASALGVKAAGSLKGVIS